MAWCLIKHRDNYTFTALRDEGRGSDVSSFSNKGHCVKNSRGAICKVLIFPFTKYRDHLIISPDIPVEWSALLLLRNWEVPGTNSAWRPFTLHVIFRGRPQFLQEHAMT